MIFSTVQWQKKFKKIIAHNVLRLGAVPHRLNLIINHCTLSGIALSRCWAQYFI